MRAEVPPRRDYGVAHALQTPARFQVILAGKGLACIVHGGACRLESGAASAASLALGVRADSDCRRADATATAEVTSASSRSASLRTAAF